MSDTRSSSARPAAVRKPRYQPSGVLRVRTIALILSVTDPKVCPGAMTGGVPAMSVSSIGGTLSAMSSSSHDDDTKVTSHVPLRAFVSESPISGFTFRTAARYVVRGRVLRSASSE